MNLRRTGVSWKALRRAWLVVLCLLSPMLRAADSPGKFGFHIFPPARGQNLGVAQRPVSDGRGGFWFFNSGQIWRFDASGYRALGPEDGFPDGFISYSTCFPEPSTGMWFSAGKGWYHLDRTGLHPVPGLPEASSPSAPNFLAIRNEGLGVIEGGKLRIFGPPGVSPVELPSPGSGKWIKGWKSPTGDERLVVGDLGLARWDGRTWKVQSLTGLLQGRGWDVRRDRSGALWVRSDRDLARVEPSPARFGPRLGFTRNSFVSLEEDPFGRVWTNGPEGIACVEGDQVWRIGEREGLFGNHAYWPIAFDREGSLWTISAAGFQRLKGGFLWSVQEQPHGLPRAMIFKITRLPRDGRLYAGTHDGLYFRGPKLWEMVKGTEGWALFAIAERQNGEIWCGGNPPEAYYQTILRIRPGLPAVRQPIEGFPSGVWTFKMCWDKGDALWCTTAKGLFRIKAQGDGFKAERIILPGTGPDSSPNWLGHTPDGTFWVAADEGLYQRQGEGWKVLKKADGMASDEATGAFDGPDGEFWVLHDGSKAITRLRNVPGLGWAVAGRLEKGHPLTLNGLEGGWTDPQGHVWIQTSNEVVRWDGYRAEHHTKAFGLPVGDLWPGAIWGEPDGRLYLGSFSGMICFDPRFYRPLPDPPALEGCVALDGQGRPFHNGAELPFRKTGVSFELQLPLVEGVEDLQVQTRMLGLDEEWHPLEGPDLRLPGLPPGDYVLEARASRRDGLCGPVYSVPFKVLRPWYIRTLALVGWLLSIGGLTVAFFQWRTWTLRREQARLEGLVVQRTSDLVQANEALFQALTEVKTLKGLVPICCYCKKIRDDAGFWNQIERYIQEHSEAKFSHGICPECERKVREQMEEENLLPRSPLESQKTPS